MTNFIILLSLLLVLLPTTTSLQMWHEGVPLMSHQLDISEYITGRSMKINKCFSVLNDPHTIFTFAPSPQTATPPKFVLTIVACQTHTCDYTLDSYKISFTKCQQTTHNSCQQDKGADYVDRFERSDSIILQANLLTFQDSRELPTIQLADIK